MTAFCIIVHLLQVTKRFTGKDVCLEQIKMFFATSQQIMYYMLYNIVGNSKYGAIRTESLGLIEDLLDKLTGMWPLQALFCFF